ncbi:GAF domain-containing protein [Neosynechococcus sphagnicola]|uniref:GAF domain-containing protein n=1 Tax=Neosynechococcus sphagnicola TaxID=1501145 RepID=UPI0006923338|nr:GAF domain-containing protein [Neosynechococcus sphagnicola]
MPNPPPVSDLCYLVQPTLLQGVAQATNQLLIHQDFDSAIAQALAILGEVTGVDRVYIFETHPHPETTEPAMSQRFEWARPSVTAQHPNPQLQNLSYRGAGLLRWLEKLTAGESIAGLVREFPAGERPCLEAQEIRSILVVPILIQPGEHPSYAELSQSPSAVPVLWGFIGFDDCHCDRQWSGDEEAVLMTMAANVGGLIAQQQTLEALRVSEEKFSKAFRASPNPLSLSTLQEGRFIEVNHSFLRISGYQRSEVIGHTVAELQLWLDSPAREGQRPAFGHRLLQQLQTQREVQELECRFRTKSGETFIGLLSAELIYVNGVACILAVTTDITERKRSELLLQASAERARLLAEVSLRIRQSLDLETILNTAVLEVRHLLQADRVLIGQMTGETRGQVVAESVAPDRMSLKGWVADECSLREFRAKFEQRHPQAIDDIAELQFSPWLTSYYRRFEIKASLAVPSFVDQQLYGVLVAQQCSAPRHWQAAEVELLEQLATQIAIATQQAQLYHQVQTLNTTLEQQVADRTAQIQQKVQELQELNQLKEAFMQSVTHELRTPVMGTIMVLKNLLRHSEDPIPLSRCLLDRMIQSCDRQLLMINSLLDVHRSELQGVTLTCQPLRLQEWLPQLLSKLAPNLDKNQATVSYDLAADLPPITTDPTQLQRVFENLITTALKHNPPGLALSVQAWVASGMLHCTLADNGIGLEAEDCDRLFELYTQGGNTRYCPSMGMQLYLCRQIITANGGEIGVRSQAGAGVTFWFTLPLQAPASCLRPR